MENENLGDHLAIIIFHMLRLLRNYVGRSDSSFNQSKSVMDDHTLFLEMIHQMIIFLHYLITMCSVAHGMVYGVLSDAEEKQLTDRAAKKCGWKISETWLTMLRTYWTSLPPKHRRQSHGASRFNIGKFTPVLVYYLLSAWDELAKTVHVRLAYTESKP